MSGSVFKITTSILGFQRARLKAVCSNKHKTFGGAGLPAGSEIAFKNIDLETAFFVFSAAFCQSLPVFSYNFPDCRFIVAFLTYKTDSV